MGVETPILKSHDLPAALPPRKFAILLNGHCTEYVRKNYGGVANLVKQLLSDPGETWEVFSIIDSFFPSEDEIDKYEAFVITGSRHDAHGSEPWVLQLCNLIQTIHRKNKKLLGICFGHQVIGRALGGKTGPAHNGWECGLKRITFTEAMQSKAYGLKLPSTVNIIKIHQDEILELPPGGQILASSERTSIEIFAIGDKVLGIQGHPEFTEDITMEILQDCIFRTIFPLDSVEQAKQSFQHSQPDREMLKQLCKTFLKGSTNSLLHSNHSI